MAWSSGRIIFQEPGYVTRPDYTGYQETDYYGPEKRSRGSLLIITYKQGWEQKAKGIIPWNQDGIQERSWKIGIRD